MLGDNEFMDVSQKPDTSDVADDESSPSRNTRSSPEALLVLILVSIPLGILYYYIAKRPGGLQIFAMVAYSALIPYIASNCFLNEVPWRRLTRKRFLVAHCLYLALMYCIVTFAEAIKPNLPAWSIHEGRKGSLFQFILIVIFVIMACFELAWRKKHSDEDASVDQL